MKIKSANKNIKSKASTGKSVYEVERIDEKTPGTDMFDIEFVSTPVDENNSGKLELLVSSIPESLVSSGYEKIEIVVEEDRVDKLPKKSTPKDIDRFFSKKELAGKDEIKFEIDNTETIDKKLLPKLATNSILEKNDDNTDDELELVYTKSFNKKIEKAVEEPEIFSARSSQDDKQGILEVRLGKINENFKDKKITEMSSKDLDSGILQESAVDRSRSLIERNAELPIAKKTTLVKTLTGKTTNKGNRRRPSLLRKEGITHGVKNLSPKRPQIPFVKSVKKNIRPKIKVNKLKFDLPGPKSNLAVRIRNPKTGKVLYKPIKPDRTPVIPLKETYRFIDESNVPKISVVYLDNSQVLVRITDIDRRTENITVYRREISKRTNEDQYEEIFSSENTGTSISFIDTIENARAFKYVCQPDDSPLYSYQVFKNKDFVYSNFEEPFSFAYQDRENVVIECRNTPRDIRKLYVYRKSSAEDEEVLVDGIFIAGRNRRIIRMIDEPVPIEQVITYRLVGVDEDGIETSYEEKPEVIYTSKLGREPGNILDFRSSYNSDTNSVDIEGTAIVENIFIANNDSELKNPSEDTLKAAARFQKIIKIQVRRINIKTEEDEIILKEIINPGLSKFNTNLLSLDRLKFSFEDSAENALIFGYSPIRDRSFYRYIARVIIYPLGVELRKVSDFEKIDGIRAPGRLRYQFDPIIFDHPLNVELGIMPSGANDKSYQLADIVGQTSAVKVSQTFVVDADTENSVSVKTSVHIDSSISPVVKLEASIASGLIDDLDHIGIEMSYDTVKSTDEIDKVFITGGSFTYYDYSFDDLACSVVGYRLIGYGKNFEKVFVSDYSYINTDDPVIKKAIKRKKAWKEAVRSRHKEIKKAKMAERINDRDEGR